MIWSTVTLFAAAMVLQLSPAWTLYVELVLGVLGLAGAGAPLVAEGGAATLLAAGGFGEPLPVAGPGAPLAEGEAALLAAGGGAALLAPTGGGEAAPLLLGVGGAPPLLPPDEGVEGPEGPHAPPVGGPSLAWLITWRSEPGLGNLMSVLSGVWQSTPLTLATMMSGLLARVLEPLPVMVTGAQFMYISRLPVLLNQVHAKMASPAFVSAGTVKSKSPGPEGLTQPPSMDLMTLKVFPLSKESESWQEPPLCAAPPSMLSFWGLPAAQVAVGLPAGVPKSDW